MQEDESVRVGLQLCPDQGGGERNHPEGEYGDVHEGISGEQTDQHLHRGDGLRQPEEKKRENEQQAGLKEHPSLLEINSGEDR